MLNKVRRLGLWLAIPYLAWILYLLLSPGLNPLEELNLELLRTLKRQYQFEQTAVFLRQFVGNIGILLPFGLLGVIWGKPLLKTLGLVLLGSTVIEVIQYALPIDRVADVDDVLLNVVGGLVGWLLGWPIYKLLQRSEKPGGEAVSN